MVYQSGLGVAARSVTCNLLRHSDLTQLRLSVEYKHIDNMYIGLQILTSIFLSLN